MTMSTLAWASIGDDGALNARLSDALADIWIDRDLSWLDFNARVLAEALDERTPLLERVKFLAIFTSNLDEFFMKRMSVLRQSAAPEHAELIPEIRRRLEQSLARQASCFRNTIVPGLANHGVALRKWDDLTEAQREEASLYFDSQV